MAGAKDSCVGAEYVFASYTDHAGNDWRDCLVLMEQYRRGMDPKYQTTDSIARNWSAANIPSVGVLIWIGYYSRDLWRLYLYVPGPAAIAMFSLLALLTTPIRRKRHRNAVLVALCLLLTLPAISRLFLQHEHYVTSANNKRRILEQIVQLAPELENQTMLLVLSQMSDEDFQQKHIEEMKSNMIGNAMYIRHYVLGTRL